MVVALSSRVINASQNADADPKHVADANSMVTLTAGLLPVRRRRHEELMHTLTGGNMTDPNSLFGTPQQASPLTGLHPPQA